MQMSSLQKCLSEMKIDIIETTDDRAMTENLKRKLTVNIDSKQKNLSCFILKSVSQ